MPAQFSADPLVSIVMPVYGVEKYLGEAVSDALAQTRRTGGSRSFSSTAGHWTDARPYATPVWSATTGCASSISPTAACPMHATSAWRRPAVSICTSWPRTTASCISPTCFTTAGCGRAVHSPSADLTTDWIQAAQNRRAYIIGHYPQPWRFVALQTLNVLGNLNYETMKRSIMFHLSLDSDAQLGVPASPHACVDHRRIAVSRRSGPRPGRARRRRVTWHWL